MTRLLTPILAAALLAFGAGASTPRTAPATASAPAATVAARGPGWAHWWEAYSFTPAGWSLSSTSHEVTGVASTLVVPEVTSVGALGTDVWIGVGVGKLLVQDGVWLSATGHDNAWAATCPGCDPTPAPITDRVAPGDRMRFSISYSGGDRWLSTISNTTAGWSWVDPLTSPPPVGYVAQWADEYGPVSFSGGGFRWWQPTVTLPGGTPQPATANGSVIAAGTLRFDNPRHLIVRNRVPPPHTTVTRIGAHSAWLRAYGPLPPGHRMHLVHRVVTGVRTTTTVLPVTDPGAWSLRCAPPDQSCLLALVTAHGATLAFARFAP